MAKMKIKAKEKGGVVKVKAMFTSLMADKEESIKKGIKPEYIKYIVAKVNDAVVFEVSTSGFMSENPLVKFKFNGKSGDEITFTTIDNNEKTETGSEKIK
ncbi:sulfur oxidation protein SoxZ [Sulfurimonas gotlandica GD1]|uniref:Sulfur oxidation protein SoxZ n=1 Tax=Sulfurimonas gotlandica (strain DSM 19862 / JCM 16533 / GD1) TaxID=929558 RepID=B6BGQ5_SULGG|nr:thiosulfate oxidation carrier complex protein SoxZ [Sulfurimonas gotlandica]EDZ63731.1 Sulphur oxidation protein SoxZ [Sulfurimonas gotlandica GD1]EHP29686.1 sulfur oxidation protein SoxZ [Sulfurimonas gotlandica GD1]